MFETLLNVRAVLLIVFMLFDFRPCLVDAVVNFKVISALSTIYVGQTMIRNYCPLPQMAQLGIVIGSFLCRSPVNNYTPFVFRFLFWELNRPQGLYSAKLISMFGAKPT